VLFVFPTVVTSVLQKEGARREGLAGGEQHISEQQAGEASYTEPLSASQEPQGSKPRLPGFV
jgi:hypothetical protein